MKSIFKRQMSKGAAEYQLELKELLKTAKHKKITQFFKPQE